MLVASLISITCQRETEKNDLEIDMNLKWTQNEKQFICTHLRAQLATG